MTVIKPISFIDAALGVPDGFEASVVAAATCAAARVVDVVTI